ncbi:MAG: hypothetical protein ABIH37_03540 [archaeon]
MVELILTQILLSVGVGAAGGAVRIIVSSLRRKQLNLGISWNSFLTLLIIYLVIGALSGLLLGDAGKVMSFLGGYAAVDLMDVYHKTFVKKKVKVK